MCLDTVTKTNLNESGVGWKVFEVDDGKVCGEIFGSYDKRPTNRWLHEMNFRDSIMAGLFRKKGYPYGFHIFKHPQTAKRWADRHTGGEFIYIKVKYRRGHTLGRQYKGNVIVAKEMLILPNQLKNKKSEK